MSVTLHGVTDDDVAEQGCDPAEVLDAFLLALDGRRLLAHFAPMETGFWGKLHADVRGSRCAELYLALTAQ